MNIGMLIFPDMTQLDFTGPHQFLGRLPNTELVVASLTGEPITSNGLTFAGLGRLADILGRVGERD